MKSRRSPVSTMEEFNTTEDIAAVVIREDSVGNHVRLRDIATIRDTHEEPRTVSRFNGKPSVSLNIYKRAGSNTLQLVERIRELAREKEQVLSSGVEISVTGDFTERIQTALTRLSSNGLLGGALVLLLLLFLGWRNALFVSWGIPITFLLTFPCVEWYGESLNEASLFALVLVLGMIVDDAIVVVENIARYLTRGVPPRQAAIQGAEE